MFARTERSSLCEICLVSAARSATEHELDRPARSSAPLSTRRTAASGRSNVSTVISLAAAIADIHGGRRQVRRVPRKPTRPSLPKSSEREITTKAFPLALQSAFARSPPTVALVMWTGDHPRRGGARRAP
jgi:hypothetical protein